MVVTFDDRQLPAFVGHYYSFNLFCQKRYARHGRNCRQGYAKLYIMILIEPYTGTSVAEHRVEIVERKGTGHPDYPCDSMMEAISIALSKEYMRVFGTILHHNIDKGLLAAGRVEKRFGGGRVLAPGGGYL